MVDVDAEKNSTLVTPFPVELLRLFELRILPPVPPSKPDERSKMTTGTTFVSRYDQRVKLVHDIVTEHTKLDSKAASELAMLVLHAIDSIPEKVR